MSSLRRGRHKNIANVKPIALRLRGDTLTPISALIRLRRRGEPVFLFESTSHHRGLKTSYIGLDPIATLTVQDGQLLVRRDGQTISYEQPLKELELFLSQYRAERRPDLPPFQGVAIGYNGFGCVRYLEPSLQRCLGAAPLGVAEAHLALCRSVVCFDHHSGRAHIIVNALLADDNAEQKAEQRAAELFEKLQRPLPEEETVSLLQNGLDSLPADVPAMRPLLGQDHFFAAVRNVKAHIRRGDIFQCVLSDRFQMKVKSDPLSIYRALRAESGSPYQFYLDDSRQVLLGASPELLVEVAGDHVETHPIAGTRPRGGSVAEDNRRARDLLRSPKERAEHLMLVDLGRNDLGRVCRAGSVTVRELMQVERFARVMHLTSKVQGRLRPDSTPWEALWACFPAGTLSGAPKLRAIEILSELEGSGRPCYGGAVVHAGFGGELAACITIRSLLLRDGVAYAQAGAGIVADSRPEREYQEVLHKTAAVRRAVAQAEAEAQRQEAKRVP